MQVELVNDWTFPSLSHSVDVHRGMEFVRQKQQEKVQLPDYTRFRPVHDKTPSSTTTASTDSHITTSNSLFFKLISNMDGLSQEDSEERRCEQVTQSWLPVVLAVGNLDCIRDSDDVFNS